MRNPEIESSAPVTPRDILRIECRFRELLNDQAKSSRENNGNGQFCNDEDDVCRRLALEFPLRAFLEWQACQAAIAEYKKRYPEEWESFVKSNGSGDNHHGNNKE
jgi:hypothetical protein